MAQDTQRTDTPRGFSRRRLLAMGLTGLAALVGAPLVRVSTWIVPPTADGLQVLTQTEHDIAEAIAEAFFPPNAGLPVDGKTAKLAKHLDEYWAWHPPDKVVLLRLLLHVINDQALVWGSGLATYVDRPLDERIAILRSWTDAEIHAGRSGVLALKMMFATVYHENTNVLEHFGIRAKCGTYHRGPGE